MEKLLFITHEASRTGAPFVILFFLQWLQKHHPEFEISVLTLKDGDLEEELKKVCSTYYTLSEYQQKKDKNVISKGLRKLGVSKPLKNKKTLITELATKEFDLVYSNTILALSLGNEISNSNLKTKHIVHIHELNAIMKILLPKFSILQKSVTHFIAASNLVKNNLVDNWNVSETKITRVYECSKVQPNTTAILPNKKTFHVGGAGTVHWRKGSDLFVQVAKHIQENYPTAKVQFTWVGEISSFERIIIEEDIRKLGLENSVSFVGQQNEPQHYFEAFDVFLMTSREDPFPLVCIELGMLGKPIICFEGATGSEEIIKKGGGVCVPYLSTEIMAKEVMNYKNNIDLLHKHGGINKVEFSKFTPEHICPELFQVIGKYI
jgi:glycosyltransferase involved in cell wall biosynthesis